MTANRAESDKSACDPVISVHQKDEIQVIQRRSLVFAAQANESRRIIGDYERRLDETRQLLEESRTRFRVVGQRLDENSRLLGEERQRLAEERQRLAEEQQRHASDVGQLEQRLAEERQRLAEEQQRLAEEQQRLAEEQQRHASDVGQLEQRLAEERERHADARRELGELSVQIRSIYDSTSWRIMEPARWVARRHPGWAKVMRRAAKLIWWTVSLQLVRKLREFHRSPD